MEVDVEVKKDERFWERVICFHKPVYAARYRCKKCFEPWAGRCDEDDKPLCTACGVSGQLQTRRVFPDERRACPHCGSVNIERKMKITFEDDASWSDHEQDYFNHARKYSCDDWAYETDYGITGRCNHCENEFDWRTAPKMNDGLKDVPPPKSKLYEQMREMLAVIHAKNKGDQATDKKLLKLLENINEREGMDRNG